MIKTIIFDIGGVLQLGKYDYPGKRGYHTLGIHEYMAKKFKMSLDAWFDRIDSPYVKSIEGKISRKKAISELSRNLNTSESKFVKLFCKSYKKHFKKNRKLYRIVSKLKKRGYNIGVLSDQWYLSKDVIASGKYIEGFNPVIISCDVGIRKPNIKIYRLLIKKCKCKAGEILFIDNRKENLSPARKLGMKAILYKDNKQLIKEFKKRGLMG